MKLWIDAQGAVWDTADNPHSLLLPDVGRLYALKERLPDIVHAVNVHDALIDDVVQLQEALIEARRVIAMLCDEAPAHTWIDTTCDMAALAIEQARAALAVTEDVHE
jgi:hypothetical protein